ncbi:MAG: type VII secretion protein EssC, partial [Clostridium sp.]
INNNIFYKSPRFKSEIVKKEFKIDVPPSRDNRQDVPVIYMLGPAITMGMTSVMTGALSVQNVISSGGSMTNALPTILMSFSMLAGTVLWPTLTKRYEKKKRKEFERVRQDKYSKYLLSKKDEINQEIESQSRILTSNFIPIEECVKRIERLQRNLWERTNSHNDFLKVRLGLGVLELDGEISCQEKKFTIEEDNLLDEMYKLVEEPKLLIDVPITISFFDEKVSGIIGRRENVSDLLKSIMFQIVTLHGYDEVKFICIIDKEEERDGWQFLRWLPHSWNDEKTIRFLGTNEQDMKELSSEMEKIISQRKENKNSKEEEQVPHYIVFSMSKELCEKGEFVKEILRSKEDIGFSLVTVYDELKDLPKECSKVIEVSRMGSKIYDKDDTSGNFTEFKTDNLAIKNTEDLAVKLSNIKLDTGKGSYALPEMLTFLEMFKVSKIEHLNILEKWSQNDPTKTIETEIGVNVMGEPFKLDLHEKFHGPHGLVAGMTGSGKSEFIMTFILSLAVNYHPNEVAFILIDYKGGGMANAFTKLPHLAGTITNLDGAAVKRSLISIQSELKRRQALFGEAGRNLNISNIDIYKYQKLYREGKVHEPLQHLFMISDEFAELKTQQPEFMEQLISAARIGRSLGVHLILATQKPAGVVDDQIWSNSKFRVCLKVQEKADSMDMIKRADAAEIAETGRFYLQVGFNELFEMGQSAWAGAPYYPSNQVESDVDESVEAIDDLGRIVRSVKFDRRIGVSKNPPKQIDEIVNYIKEISDEEGIKIRQLWLEPISQLIYLNEVKKKYDIKDRKHYFNPVIGEYDDPSTQSQKVMTLNISEEGNAVIYGGAGNGKTTFLTTMLYSLMEGHTPEEMNMYILDFSAETLRAFEKSPHVGDVILSYESEKINNLFKMLYSEIERRKKLFGDFGGDYYSYIRNSKQSIEGITIVIHNFTSFIETYENKEDDILYLTREGTKYGIYFIVTSLNTNGVRYRLLQNFRQLIALQLNDSGDYSSVLGNTQGVLPSKFKGRGLFKGDKVYEFQTCHVFKDRDNTFDLIREYSKEKSKEWGKPGAKKVKVLPDKVDLNYLREEIEFTKDERIPIGIEKEELKTSYYDFDTPFVSIISGQNIYETSFVQGITEIISEYNNTTLVIDCKGAFNEDNSKKYRYISKEKDVSDVTLEIFKTLVERHNTIKLSTQKGEEPPKYEKIKVIIYSFSEYMSKLTEDGRDKVKVFMTNGQAKYNINFIIVEDTSAISEITYEEWFKKHCTLKDGVWLGNGISEQYTLKVNKLSRDMYGEIPKGFGYVLNNGRASFVKLVSSVNESEGE